MTHNFPGNVRELENLVEQAAALSEGEELLPEDFPLRPQARHPHPGQPGMPSVPELPSGPGFTLASVVEEAERRAIAQALERHGVDLVRVAEELGVSSTTLWRKMKRFNLRPPGEVGRD
jgi:two-component system response regulator HydG